MRLPHTLLALGVVAGLAACGAPAEPAAVVTETQVETRTRTETIEPTVDATTAAPATVAPAIEVTTKAPKPRKTKRATPKPTKTKKKSVYYANCAAARAAGAAPLYAGEPGYRAGLDRDGDGVACES